MNRSLKSGGKIELVDFDLLFTSDDGTVSNTNQLTKFCDDLVDAAGRVGCDLRVAPKYEELLRDADFTRINREILKFPMGPWARDKRLKTIGFCHREQFLQGMSGIGMGLFTRILRWPREEVEVYLALVRQDIANPKIHGYWRRSVAFLRSICFNANSLVATSCQQRKLRGLDKRREAETFGILGYDSELNDWRAKLLNMYD